MPGAGRVYLDHNAATPISPEAVAAMSRAAVELQGNPSSIHASGRQARAAVERARRDAAAFVGAAPAELVFTSGATEGNVMVIGGLARAMASRRRAEGRAPGAVVTSAVEHPSVLAAVEALAQDGIQHRLWPVDAHGRPRMEALDALLNDDCLLLTISAAHHELGHIAPLQHLARAAHACGALLHTDAAQAAGRIRLDLHALEVDAATFSGRKMHGPPGTGMVYLRQGVQCMPLLRGGHQERGLRAGTENVPGIVGLAAACGVAARTIDSQPEIAALRDRLQDRLLALPGARLHGSTSHRLAGTLNIGFAGVPGHIAVAALDLEGVEASTGAACSSGTVEPSAVLLAMGLDRERAGEAIRFSLGPETSAADVERAAELMAVIVHRIRGAAPCSAGHR